MLEAQITSPIVSEEVRYVEWGQEGFRLARIGGMVRMTMPQKSALCLALHWEDGECVSYKPFDNLPGEILTMAELAVKVKALDEDKQETVCADSPVSTDDVRGEDGTVVERGDENESGDAGRSVPSGPGLG